jgi:hypothetical protein
MMIALVIERGPSAFGQTVGLGFQVHARQVVGVRLTKAVRVSPKTRKKKNRPKMPDHKSDPDPTGLIARCLADHQVGNAPQLLPPFWSAL